MDSVKCKAFLTVLEKGSLSLAAEELGYTPSGISRMIDSLEEETGFSLLLRSRKGVRLTEEGAAMLPSFRELVRADELCLQKARQILGVDVGHIHIATAYFAFYPWLGELIAGFHEDYPGISVDIRELPSGTSGQALDEGTLDLAFMSRREGAHDFVLIRRDPLVAILPPDHPCAGQKSISAERFAKEPFIELLPQVETDNALYFRRHGIRPNIHFTTSDTLSAAAMVAAGLGIASSNRIVAEELGAQVAIVPLSPTGNVEIGMAWPRQELLSPAAERFLEYIRARWEDCPLREA